MKWFFALNDYSTAFELYSQMVKVAVFSARQNTSLEPYCIYDGKENDFTAWLRRQGVQILFHRTPHYEKLKTLDPLRFAAGGGAFLRVEVPKLIEQHNWSDEFVLYTDVDVLFLQDVVPELNQIACEYFAVAPESDPKNWEIINSGVMLMNVKTLLNVHDAFNQYIDVNIPELVYISFDQEAYIRFFAGKWQSLRLELNWKSYWDENPEAKVIHFHGPKPNEIEQIRARYLPPDRITLANYNFCRNVLQWQRVYENVLLEEKQRIETQEKLLMKSRNTLQQMMLAVLEYQGLAILPSATDPSTTDIVLGFALDLPIAGEKFIVEQSLMIGGWLLIRDQSAIAIELFARDQLIASTPVNIHRPDVAKVYPQVSNAEFSGFTTVVEPISATFCSTGLSLQAVLQDQSRIILGNLQFRPI